MKYIFFGFISFAFFFIVGTFFNVSFNPVYLTFWITILFSVSISGYYLSKDGRAVASFLITVFVIIGFIILFILHSTMIESKKLASSLEIKEVKASSIHFDKQRSVTKSMALKIANKVLGQEINGVQISSQYEINSKNSSIQLVNNKLVWVLPLDYSGFFQWLKQKYIPGYVTVSATNPRGTAKLHLGYKMIVSSNSYFMANINRLSFFRSGMNRVYTHFEINNKGEPYFISLVVKPSVVFRSFKTTEVIVTNAQTNKSDITSFKEASVKYPWIDRLIQGSLVNKQIEWYGSLSKGYLNKIFSQENVNVPTQYEGRELWIAHVNGREVFFTGMSSVNNKDQSLVQGIIIDTKTGKGQAFDLAGVMDEAGAVSVLDSALGANSVKWKPVLPQPFMIKGQFYWGSSIVSNSNIYQEAGIVNGKNQSKIFFGKNFYFVKKMISLGVNSHNRSKEYIKVKKRVLLKILAKTKEIERLEAELY